MNFFGPFTLVYIPLYIKSNKFFNIFRRYTAIVELLDLGIIRWSDAPVVISGFMKDAWHLVRLLCQLFQGIHFGCLFVQCVIWGLSA